MRVEAGGVEKLSKGRREAYLQKLEQMRDVLADEDLACPTKRYQSLS